MPLWKKKTKFLIIECIKKTCTTNSSIRLKQHYRPFIKLPASTCLYKVFLPSEFGVVTEMYAYVAFFVVILTYGMETAFSISPIIKRN